MKKLLALALLASSAALAQFNSTPPPGAIVVSSSPAGNSCTSLTAKAKIYSGTIYTCQSGTYAAVSSGGGFSNPMTTSGDMIYGGASGAATRLAGGTSGYVLTSNGATSAPSWQAATGGGGGSSTPGALVLLEQHTASSSSELDFTSSLSSTYDTYLIEFVDVLPSTNANPEIQFSTNGGSSYDSSSIYTSQFTYENGASSGYVNTGTSLTSAQLLSGNSVTSTWPLRGTLQLSNPNSSAYKSLFGNIEVKYTGDTSSAPTVLTLSDSYKNTAAINAFKFFYSTGNIASGTVRVYGITNSVGVGAAAVVTAPALRGSSIVTANLGSSYAVSFPSGTQAGDTVVLFQSGSNTVNGISGWTTLQSGVSSGAWISGAVFSRVLTAADITTGSVTVTFGSGSNGTVSMAVFKGYVSVRSSADYRDNSSHSNSITLSTPDGSPQTTDMALYFSGEVSASTDSVSLGTQLQQSSTSGSSGCLFAGSPSVPGGISPVYTHTGSPNSYQAYVVITAPAGVPVTSGLAPLGTYTASSVNELDVVTRNAPGRSGAIFQSDFSEYEIHVRGWTRSTSANALMQFSTNGGTSYDTTANNYTFVGNYAYPSTNAGGSGNNTNATNFPLTDDTADTDASNTFMTARWTLFDPLGAGYKVIQGQATAPAPGRTSGAILTFSRSGVYRSTSAVNAFRALASAGTFSGTITVFGVSTP